MRRIGRPVRGHSSRCAPSAARSSGAPTSPPPAETTTASRRAAAGAGRSAATKPVWRTGTRRSACGGNVCSSRAKRGSLCTRRRPGGRWRARTRARRARLVGAAADEDVAHAGERRDAVAPGRREQRQQLAGEARAPERPQLDQHHVGSHVGVRGEDPLAPGRPRAGEREPGVVADERPRRPDAEGRQRDDLDAGRRGHPVGERAAAHEHDAEALDQRRALRVCAGQVAEADRVLAPEEQRGSHRTSAPAAPR